MTEHITYTKIEGGYKAIFHNGVELGEILMDVDGFYYYWPVQRAGSWSGWVMRLIADKLDELNKPYEAEINAYFEMIGQGGLQKP